MIAAARNEFASDDENVTFIEIVRLSVLDRGIGMDERTQARVFEPFWHRQAAGGAVRIDSQLGRGTTVDVFFPVARRESE